MSPSWATCLKWFIFSIFLSQILNLRFFISYPSFVPPISYQIPITWSISYTIRNARVPFHMSPSWATRLKWFIFSICYKSQILNLRFFISYPRFCTSNILPDPNSLEHKLHNKKFRSSIPHVPHLGQHV